MSEIKIRSYKNGDEKNFYKLDRILEEHPFNRRSIENFLWKFRGKNPFGKATNFFCYSKKELLAHFGAIPLIWNINNRKVLAGCSIAMMVKPEWQNKGLIKFVGDKVFVELKKNKFNFIYGYPNNKSYDLHLKFWKYQNCILQKTYVLKKKIKVISKNFTIKKIKKFDKHYDKFWNKNYKTHDAILDRNSNFLNWRYIDRPDCKYLCYYLFNDLNEIQGYFVLKFYKDKKLKKIHIIDIFLKNLNKVQLKQVCYSIIETIYKCNLNENQISFWLNGNKNLLNAFKSIGFKACDKRVMIIKKLDERNCKINSINLSKIYFTMGDTLEIY